MENATAKDFFLNNYFKGGISQKEKGLWFDTNRQAMDSVSIMIEFAKLHVEAALKEANKRAIMTGYIDSGQTILNAYPLKNIK
jgi:hypothetical protein